MVVQCAQSLFQPRTSRICPCLLTSGPHIVLKVYAYGFPIFLNDAHIGLDAIKLAESPYLGRYLRTVQFRGSCGRHSLYHIHQILSY